MNIDNASGFSVSYSHTTQVEIYASYEDAVATLEAVYTDCYTEVFEDRALCWRDEKSSENDDGARAIAGIWPVFDGA